MICRTCGRDMQREKEGPSFDCGGDCTACMAEIHEDPECIKSLMLFYMHLWHRYIDRAAGLQVTEAGGAEPSRRMCA